MTMFDQICEAVYRVRQIGEADRKEIALEVLKELRRPTAGMFTAGQRAVSKSDPKAVRTVDWEVVFVAMIDAAIAEATK